MCAAGVENTVFIFTSSVISKFFVSVNVSEIIRIKVYEC